MSLKTSPRVPASPFTARMPTIHLEEMPKRFRCCNDAPCVFSCSTILERPNIAANRSAVRRWLDRINVRDHARSKRSRFITLFQAATKSWMNFFSASELP